MVRHALIFRKILLEIPLNGQNVRNKSSQEPPKTPATGYLHNPLDPQPTTPRPTTPLDPQPLFDQS